MKQTTKMSSSGEEEETGPSVDSADPEERIAARRIRIQRRREAQRRYGTNVNSPKIEKSFMVLRRLVPVSLNRD